MHVFVEKKIKIKQKRLIKIHYVYSLNETDGGQCTIKLMYNEKMLINVQERKLSFRVHLIIFREEPLIL